MLMPLVGMAFVGVVGMFRVDCMFTCRTLLGIVAAAASKFEAFGLLAVAVMVFHST